MKAWKVLVVVLVAVTTVALVVRACKDTVKLNNNEDELRYIDSTRAINNAVPIPFRCDSLRDSVLGSVNQKTGFNLYLRKPKGN